MKIAPIQSKIDCVKSKFFLVNLTIRSYSSPSMSTCPPNLRHSFLTICEIIRFKSKKKLFSTMPERYSSVLGAKKTIFGLKYGMLDFTFLFLVELGTCVQNLIFTKVVEGC
jgi:hypothetical protein